MDSIRTTDGATVRVGDRVNAYYYGGPGRGVWGVITNIESNGWADVTLDDGRRVTADGDRLAVTQ
jgi:hypothetical protein